MTLLSQYTHTHTHTQGVFWTGGHILHSCPVDQNKVFHINMCLTMLYFFIMITLDNSFTWKESYILYSIIYDRRVTDSYCHSQIHTGHLQNFHNRVSMCIVTCHAHFLIRDPYTRKQSVLGYMFVGSDIICCGPENTIWNMAAFGKRKNILCRVWQKSLWL